MFFTVLPYKDTNSFFILFVINKKLAQEIQSTIIQG